MGAARRRDHDGGPDDVTRWLRSVRLRARALFRMDAVDRDLGDEIRDHLQHLIDENLRAGMSIDAARAAARREFGPIPALMEESRDARGVAWIRNGMQDLRYGVRLMRRSPGLAVTTVLTVALGIGATAATFSLVYGVLLQPLPYPRADRLMNLWTTTRAGGLPRSYAGMANVYDWRARNHVFKDIAALRPVANFNLTGVGEPERLNGARVSANLFPVLGVTPLIGRTFNEDEDEIGHEREALLSYGLWRRRFGGVPGIVGRSIQLNGVPHLVVGVMRADFAYPTRDYQIWTPLTFDPADLVSRLNYSFMAVGRLQDGVTLQQARAELTLIARQLEREHPIPNAGTGVEVVPMLDDVVAAVRKPLYLLLGGVLAMLLVGCANLANLLFARALARQRELVVRAALGAGAARLFAQSIAEVVPMVTAGGVLGVLGAAWLLRALVPWLPPDLPRAENIGDLQVPVLLAAAAALATIALVVGAWPAIDAARGSAAGSIGNLSRGAAGGARGTRRDLIVSAEIAATLWLVISAALLMRSFVKVRNVDPGFTPDRVYTLHLAIPRSKYPRDPDVAAFIARLMERVQSIPDVTSVGLVNRLPLAGGAQIGGVEFEGKPATAATPVQSDWRTVTPAYFTTLQIPLLVGRPFTEHDDERAPLVVIIDDQLARAVFGSSQQAVGHRLRIAVAGQPWHTIVGVVGHIRHDRLDADTRPQVYWNYRQRTQDRMAMAVRTRGEPAGVAESIVAAVHAEDPEQPVYDARSLETVVDRSLAQRQLQVALIGAFAAVALALAAIGVYGVIAYAVGQRQREFGIRLALGARSSGIVGLVIGHGLLLFAAGAAAGLLAAFATARVLASLLFNVASVDLPSFAGATAVLFLVAVAACAVPAMRAARVDPALALRAE
jgi:putative ABC transport system permease protein